MHSFGCCCFPSGRRSEIPGHASPIRESRMATSYRPSSCQKGRGWARVRGHSKGSQSVSQRDRPQGSRDCGFRTGPSRRQRQKLIQHRWRCRLFLMLLCLDRRDLFVLAHDMTARNMMKGPGPDSSFSSRVRVRVRRWSWGLVAVHIGRRGFAFWHFYLCLLCWAFV